MSDHKITHDTQLKMPLTVPTAQHEVTTAPESDGLFSRISILGLLFLAFNCGMAIYHSRHDPLSILFITSSFVDLILLFYFLRRFESVGQDSPERGQIKAIVWSLSTILTLMFSYRVAALMPFPVAVIVWVMAGSTIFAGFYMFFVFKDEASVDEKPLKVAQDP